MPPVKYPGLNATNIEWTDFTLNPFGGCTKCSDGCANCYALVVADKMSRNPKMSDEARAKYDSAVVTRDGKPEWSGFIPLFEDRLLAPLHRKKKAKIFIGSMSDLFHPNMPVAYIDRVFAMMAACPQHTFQVLTKRPERMREYLNQFVTGNKDMVNRVLKLHDFQAFVGHVKNYRLGTPLPNVHIGVTAENQEQADARIPLLLQCPAAVRFVSAEPLLGPIRLDTLCAADVGGGRWGHNVLNQKYQSIDWVICGAETGTDARPMDPQWARDLCDQCKAGGTPFFFMQLSGKAAIPDDLLIQEYPEVKHD